MQKKMFRVEIDSPYRCQGAGKLGQGQCEFMSVKGMVAEGHLELTDPTVADNSYNCPGHGGMACITSEKKARTKQYRLQVWQERIDEFAESEDVKSLRSEIGILRMLIETTLSQCKNPQELLIYSQRLSDLIIKCEKLVRSCDRLESNMGMLLDRSSALSFAAKVVEIISKHVPDPK